MSAYTIENFENIENQPCPCGLTKRAFTTPDNKTATMHLVEIKNDAKTHYHKKITEIYLILEGTGHIELDGQIFPVKPMTTIMIKPGCRHRATGNLKIINTCIPPFNKKDEWFD